MATVIWHYTSGSHLKMILESGELRVSDWERKEGVKPPALWLSLNPIWENTATKMVLAGGQYRWLTKEEQYLNFGLVRFPIPFQKNALCSWAAYKHKSNTPLNVYWQLEKIGIERGANPSEWYASFKNIPLSECISCETWDGEKWNITIEF